MNNIELQIDKLVLHGFSPHDRHRICEAIKAQLTRILTEQGIPTSLSHDGKLPHINGGSFNTATNTKAGIIGTEIANSVYSGFKNEKTSALQSHKKR
jgi:hypothetical protein